MPEPGGDRQAAFRVICPKCRTLNETGRIRCLECGTKLERSGRLSSIRARIAAIRLESGLATLALVMLVPALALTAHAIAQFAQGLTPPPLTLKEVVERELLASRIALFALLVVGWPTLLVGCARLLNVRFPRPERVLALAGMTMGAAACLVASLPWPGPLLALLVPLLLPPAVLPAVLRLPWWPAARFSLVQLGLLVPLMLATLWGVESLLAGAPLNPARELGPIAALAGRAPLTPVTLLPGARGREFPSVHWEPGASLWLERRANRVRIEAVNPERTGDWSLSILSEDPRDSYKSGYPAVKGLRGVTFVPQTNRAYRMAFDPAGAPGDIMVVRSLLPARESASW